MKCINERPLNIITLQGSIRPGNYTAKTLGIICRAAQTIPGLDFEIINPANLTLPLPGQRTTGDVESLQINVREADGIILATPEYHGSYSSVMKLMIDNLGLPSALKDKPTALLGVAAGQIGAIKALEHLRSVASHVGAHVLPGGISIAGVKDRFDKKDRMRDPGIVRMVEGVLSDLIKYLSQTNSLAAGICAINNN